jgi:hypothetical protein
MRSRFILFELIIAFNLSLFLGFRLTFFVLLVNIHQVLIENSNFPCTIDHNQKEKNTMRKPFALILLGSAMVAGSFVGCSNKPSEEEMKQLNDLKAEVTSLEKGIAAQQSEKAALLKSIADKDAQLSQCAKDKEALQQRLKGIQ